MQDWEKALHKFLVPWRKRKDALGCLVCGSFVTGNPSKHSDIDVHIVLSDSVTWRERGNKLIDEYIYAIYNEK